MRDRLLNRISYITVAVMAAMLLAFVGTSHAWAQSEPRNVVNEDLVIDQGETLSSDVIVTNGDLIVHGILDGKATIVNGDAEIYGTVNGDLAVITGGDITLYAGSEVDGNVEDMGGTITTDPSAIITGKTLTMDVTGIGNLLNVGQAQSDPNSDTSDWAARVNPFNRVGTWIFLGGLSTLILVLAMGLAALAPRRIRISSSTLEVEPGPSIVVGIIAAILLVPLGALLTAVLTITVVGIVVVPVLWIGLFAVLLYGFVVICQWLGRRIHDSAQHPDVEATFAQKCSHSVVLVIEVMLGAAVILACTILPAIFVPGWISLLMLGMLYVLSCIGVGSGVLSKFGTLAPPKHGTHRRTVVYPSASHSRYGTTSSLVNTPITGPIHAHSNTRPLGQAPVLPKDDQQ